jgi:hypothetical protein
LGDCAGEAAFLVSVLAEFIFVIQQASLFGRNSVDVYETVSLAAINGRGSNGNCLDVRRTNTGYATSNCACTCSGSTFNIRSHGSAAMAAAGDL